MKSIDRACRETVSHIFAVVYIWACCALTAPVYISYDPNGQSAEKHRWIEFIGWWTKTTATTTTMDLNQQLILYLNFRLINWHCDGAGERSRHRRRLHLIKRPPECITFHMHWIFGVSLLGEKMPRKSHAFRFYLWRCWHLECGFFGLGSSFTSYLFFQSKMHSKLWGPSSPQTICILYLLFMNWIIM